jgi:hypothetical protein
MRHAISGIVCSSYGTSVTLQNVPENPTRTRRSFLPNDNRVVTNEDRKGSPTESEI